jgi:hypothetical protein
MKKLLLPLLILFIGCEKPEDEVQTGIIYFQGAFSPDPNLTREQATECESTIHEADYVIHKLHPKGRPEEEIIIRQSVRFISFGLKSNEETEIPVDTYIVTSIRVYDSNDQLVFKIADWEDEETHGLDNPYVVVRTPFTLFVDPGDRIGIGVQIFCWPFDF